MRNRVINRTRRAFTLIEILIVVVILGILAAIVIPQFTDASTDAQDASLRSQLQTIRSQLELYRVQNNDIYPDLITNQWADLVNGDYLQASPKNPFMGSDTNNVLVAANVTGGAGWGWDAANGELTANNGNNAVFSE